MPQSSRQDLYLPTLQQLLAISSTNVKTALTAASDIVGATFQADKVDCFLYDQECAMLIAVGTSTTPLGAKQQALGLDKLPHAAAGWDGIAFDTGRALLTGRADQEPAMVPGLPRDLGLRSMLIAPLSVHGARRGTINVSSTRPELYTAADLAILVTIAHWVGLTLHRAELLEHVSAQSPAAPSGPDAAADLAQECARLRAELDYWRATADALLLELQRWQLAHD